MLDFSDPRRLWPRGLGTAAAAQPSATPLKMLADVRDRRYCELFVIKRQGALMQSYLQIVGP